MSEACYATCGLAYAYLVLFCVFKFLENGDICYEGGAVVWIEIFINDKDVFCLAAPSGIQSNCLGWKSKDSRSQNMAVTVVKYCDTFKKARQVADGFVGNSAYETDHGETGRGKRIRNKRQQIVSSDEDEVDDLRKVKDVVAPPNISLAPKEVAKRKETQKVAISSKKRVVPTVTKSQPKLSEAEKLSKLKEKIIEERKKAMSIQEHKGEVGKIALPTGSEPGKYVKSPYKAISPAKNLTRQVALLEFESMEWKKSDHLATKLSPSNVKQCLFKEDGSEISDSKRISDEDIIPCDDWMDDESEVTKDISFYSGSPNSPSHNGSRALDYDAGEVGDECDSRVHSSLTVENRMSSKSSPLKRKATESKSPWKQKNTANLKSPKKRSSSASSSSGNRQEELLLEISSKMDIMLMNQFKANKALMPHDKRI
ncbi:hypothetical protein ONE63_011495 [Megalurothrips usitatus]|uniref:Uncharacterized protein n=1 Tax=Megalurothrips usitatus TaxID=439358 RepID=A0AAV7X5J1_9NEOP|nr:hypothetical protein ONE63_011495 [Megalurothrips usitatus]